MQVQHPSDIIALQYHDLHSSDRAVRANLLTAVAKVTHIPAIMKRALSTLEFHRTSMPGYPTATRRYIWCAMQAYGPDGLGILTVAGIPTLPELRQQLLPLSNQFVVGLPPSRPNAHAHIPLPCLHIPYKLSQHWGSSSAYGIPSLLPAWMSHLVCKFLTHVPDLTSA